MRIASTRGEMMSKSTRKVVSMLVALAATAASASAFTYTYQDIDKPGALIGKVTGNTYIPSYTGQFDIVTGDGDKNIVISGYNPISTNGTFSDIAGYAADGTLTSAYAYFYLKNANQGNDGWDINVNIYDFLVGTGAPSGVSSYTQYDDLSGAAFTFLNNNGSISYTVSAVGGNASFILEYARLTATSESPTSVPDTGSTLLLLGATIGILGAVHRKFAVCA